MRSLVLTACLLALTACASNPFEPSVPLDEQFTLKPADVVGISGTDIGVEFIGITGDSRCPGDALCIQGGDAIAAVRVHDRRGDATYELHTGDATRSSATHRGLRIVLVDVQPYPFSSLPPIVPGDYRVTLRVTR